MNVKFGNIKGKRLRSMRIAKYVVQVTPVETRTFTLGQVAGNKNVCELFYRERDIKFKAATKDMIAKKNRSGSLESPVFLKVL